MILFIIVLFALTFYFGHQMDRSRGEWRKFYTFLFFLFGVAAVSFTLALVWRAFQ